MAAQHKHADVTQLQRRYLHAGIKLGDMICQEFAATKSHLEENHLLVRVLFTKLVRSARAIEVLACRELTNDCFVLARVMLDTLLDVAHFECNPHLARGLFYMWAEEYPGDKIRAVGPWIHIAGGKRHARTLSASLVAAFDEHVSLRRKRPPTGVCPACRRPIRGCERRRWSEINRDAKAKTLLGTLSAGQRRDFDALFKLVMLDGDAEVHNRAYRMLHFLRRHGSGRLTVEGPLAPNRYREVGTVQGVASWILAYATELLVANYQLSERVASRSRRLGRVAKERLLPALREAREARCRDAQEDGAAEQEHCT